MASQKISATTANAAVAGTDEFATNQSGTSRRTSIDSIQTFLAASQATMETGTSTTKFVTPGIQKYHPLNLKAWARVTGAGVLSNSSGVGSITDTGAGRMTVNWATAFSSATNCAVTATIERAATALTVTNVQQSSLRNASIGTGSVEVESIDNTGTTNVQEDPGSYHVQACGDL